jgi:cytochrome c553
MHIDVLTARPGIEPLAGAPGHAVNTSMCIGCHGIPGYKNAFPSVYSVPLIAGQPAKYIEAALHAYRRGERSHPTMQAIARGLTEEEIVALAQYYGTPNAGAPGAGGTR